MAEIKVEESVKYEQLIGGADPAPLQEILTITAGQGILKRGSVLGISTADGKAKLVDSSVSDGSEVAKYILAEEVDTTTEVNAPAFMAGIFNEEYLTFGGTDTVDKHKTALRDVGIFLTSEKYYEEA